jgi:hypothetical protein
VLNVAAAVAGWADGASGDRSVALVVLVAAVAGHAVLTGFAAERREGKTMVWKGLLLAAVVVNAMLVGASGDQVIKQLPARHRIGEAAFSDYSQAADLSNGVPWYATLGIGAAVLAIGAVLAGLRVRPRPRALTGLLVTALVCTVAHSAVTAVAAPLNFSQREADDLADLAMIFDQFEQLTILRVVLQAAVLAALVWALARYTGSSEDHRPAVGGSVAARPSQEMS